MSVTISQQTPLEQAASAIRVVNEALQLPVAATVHTAKEFGELFLFGGTAISSVCSAAIAQDVMTKVAGQPLWDAGPASWASAAACVAGAAVPFVGYLHARFGTSPLRGLLEGAAVAGVSMGTFALTAAVGLGDAAAATATCLMTLLAGAAAIASAADAHYRGKRNGETIPEHDTFLS